MTATAKKAKPFDVAAWYRATLAAEQYPVALTFAPGKWQIGHLGRGYDDGRDRELWEQMHAHKQQVLLFLQHHGLTWSGEAIANTDLERWRVVLKTLAAAS